jgi:hypothetical protein
MEEKYFPVVAQALAGEEYTVYAYFTDGTIHLFDMKPLIANGGVFDKLKDGSFFTENLTVLNDTVAWDLSGCYDPTNCIDIDPFVVYESERVEDPLGEIA